MKKYETYNETMEVLETLYIGYADDIKATYKSIVRAFNKYNTNLCPIFCNTPRFVKSMYGLIVNEKSNSFYVVNSDTALRLLYEEILK